jgi:hypothetical protein
VRFAYLLLTTLTAAMLMPADAALGNSPGADQVINRADRALEASPTRFVADVAPLKTTLREPESAEKRQRETIRLEIETNIYRLTQCVGASFGCVAHDFPRMILGLTRSEVETLLGPPQYQLRLAGNHLYYWTVPLRTNRTVTPTRVQLTFGDCHYREKNSRKQAVCEATLP